MVYAYSYCIIPPTDQQGAAKVTALMKFIFTKELVN